MRLRRNKNGKAYADSFGKYKKMYLFCVDTSFCFYVRDKWICYAWLFAVIFNKLRHIIADLAVKNTFLFIFGWRTFAGTAHKKMI